MDASWIPFLLLCLAVELTPGPNMAYLVILSIGAGRRAGFQAVAGIALGLTVVGLLSALGVAVIISNSPIFSKLMVVAGFLYLLWLAWCSWSEASQPLPTRAEEEARPLRYFLRGLTNNLLSPKAFVFFVMLLPGFVGSANHPTAKVLWLTAIAVMVASVVHITIVLLMSQVASNLRQPRRRRIVSKIMALLLVAIAVWFAATNASFVS